VSFKTLISAAAQSPLEAKTANKNQRKKPVVSLVRFTSGL